MTKFKRYQYSLEDHEGSYTGEYTIKSTVKPLGFPGEKLIEEFETNSEPVDWNAFKEGEL